MHLIVLILAIFKALLLCLPMAVAYLALRRLLLSTTMNAWIYGLTGALMIFVVGGLVPWAFLQAPPQPVLVSLATVSPMVWLLVVSICGPGKNRPYDDDADVEEPPLLLTNPIFRKAPVFRSSPRPALQDRPDRAPAPSTSVLNAARRMRGRPGARPAASAPAMEPHLELPFLKR